MKKFNYKRIWLISDTHFGVRSNSVEWMEIQINYFKNFFIPLIKKNYKEGDVILHLGDVFDNRQSLNIKVLNAAFDIFKELSEILPVHIILGNHDIFHKNSNDTNSVKILKYIPNIYVYEEPELLQFGTSKILMMPWRTGPEAELETLQSYPEAEHLMCHTDFRGMKFNKWTDVEHGNEINVFNSFKRVYSGHIHYAQQRDNINLIGSPYQLTRSDRGNDKGIFMLDLESNKEEFFKNTYSPQFLKFDFEWLLEQPIENINHIVQDNFVDIGINSKWILNYPINLFIDLLKGYRKIGFDIMNNVEDQVIHDDIDLSQENFNILKFANEYIDGLNYEQELKDQLYKSIQSIYNKVLNQSRNEL